MGERQTRVTTSHWGAFELTVEDGRLVGAAPFAADPAPPEIPHAIPGAVHHEKRIAQPAIRRGWLQSRDREGRGRDGYVALPWDEALDIASTEIARVRAEHGNGSIYGASYGWASAGRFHHANGQLHRFLNCIGGYVGHFGSYSTGAAQAIVPHIFGTDFFTLTYEMLQPWDLIAEHTQTLVMFGGINPKNSQVSMGGNTRHVTAGWFERFAARGMTCLNIGPQRGDSPPGCAWLPLIPGTDTALMLALAWVLETEGLADRMFLDRYTVGYAQLRAYLLGQTDGEPKTPGWAAEITGVPAERIVALARQMAASRTLITVAWSLQRARFGEQPYWMAAALAAMLGSIGLPGGGIGYGYGAIGGIGVAIKPLRGLTLPQGRNPVSDFIPVARIADMLLNPGAPYAFNGADKTYPDIRLVYWCGGNPFHHHQDLHRLDEAWRRPETVIVHEPWWTATAARADIVFPATTPYEREDIGRTNLDPFLFYMPAMVPPQGAARDDFAIFAALAGRLGVADAFTEGRDAEGWLRHLYADFRQKALAEGVETPDFDMLRERNWVELPITGVEHAQIAFSAFRADPVAAPLGTPSGKIELYSETIAGFGYADCPGHPTWIPPEEWLGEADTSAPLHLTSPQPADKLHSQLECALADGPDARPVALDIHPEDAAQRGITDGSLVRVHNRRGAVCARARFSHDILRGVVAMPTGAWYGDGVGDDPDGNPNVLTRDIGTSRLGQGSSAHTALVEVSRHAPD
ncbi:MAG: molybdopterin-dependent oxidoreductase [Pseudomonadota bacterium]